MPVIPPNDTAVVDVPWSASDQEKKLNTPITPAVAKAMYAWYDGTAPDGNNDGWPDSKDAYSFPHHEVSAGGEPGAAVVSACRNGLSRLSGSNVPEADQAGVRDHLQHHIDAFNAPGKSETSDEEPSALMERLIGERKLAPLSATVAIAEDYLPVARLVCQELLIREPKAAIPSRGSQRMASGGEIAVIPLRGILTPRGSFIARLFGGTSGGLEGFRASFDEAMDDSGVSAILIDVDSPGGVVSMVPETADHIRAARGGKPIIAICNTLAASAAYWIAAQADELVITPSGFAGSIGVFAVHEDYSKMDAAIGITTTIISAGKYKTEGNSYEPLSKEAQANMQAQVDTFYAMFTDAVGAGRNVPGAAVRAGYGQGRTMLAEQALLLKMVDRIETFDQTVTRLGGIAADDDTTPDLDPDEDDDDLDPDEDDSPDAVDSDDEPEAARAESGLPADRLYGEDRHEPAWLLR